VRRRAAEAPFASTFVGVLEPFEGGANLTSTRRLELKTSDGKPCSEGCVALEIRLAGGGRDLFLSMETGNLDNPGSSPSTNSRAIEGETGLQFEGDVCLVRLNKSNEPTRVWFCRGTSLRIGQLVIRAKEEKGSVEIDLSRLDAPVVSGPADAIAEIQNRGFKIWPK